MRSSVAHTSSAAQYPTPGIGRMLTTTFLEGGGSDPFVTMVRPDRVVPSPKHCLALFKLLYHTHVVTRAKPRRKQKYVFPQFFLFPAEAPSLSGRLSPTLRRRQRRDALQ
ncbi:hypothetical protein MTO96_013098 [Rhipicephalus appendiculatus]